MRLVLYYRALMSVVLAMPLLAYAAVSSSPIIEAAKSRDIQMVRALLADSVDVNVAEADGTTALYWAALRDDLDMARLLLQSEAKADPANEYGVTPLWIACTNRSHNMVKLLLQARAEPDAPLWTGETALMNCARTGASAAVAELLNARASVNVAETSSGQTALMWAANARQPDIVRMLIEKGADVTASTRPGVATIPHTCGVCDWKIPPGGFTPLLFAARSGDITSVQLLLEAGANPNEASASHGNALVIASAGGHIDLALYLLKKGANPNSADETGITALHHAVGEGLAHLNGVIYDPVYRIRPANSIKLARALLEAGANVNAQIAEEHLLGPDGYPYSMIGATPLLLAATSADLPMLNLFYEFGADPHINTSEGVTPLMAAAQSACTGTCAYQDGGNVRNPQDIERALQVVKVIINKGVEINAAASKSGRTAMHIAAFTGSEAVVRYLAENGAQINVMDNSGETPWTMAAGMTAQISRRGLYGNHDSTARLLLSLGAREITMEELEANLPLYMGQ